MPKQNNKRMRGANRRNKQRAVFDISNAGDQVVKRMTLSNLLLGTGAGTFIPITSVSSASVQSAPATEWASFAARYQQYRVRAIRVRGKATQPIQTATVTHGVLFRGDYIGSAVPTTPAQLLADENVHENGTTRDFVDTVTWRRNPNARLWNPTSAAIPTANQYAWVCGSATSPALLTATTYYGYVVEWEVEFRGSQ